MSHPYASESIWSNKYRADEAECQWQEGLANQRCNSGGSNATVPSATVPAPKPCAKVTPTSSLVDEIARTREHIIHSLQSSNVSTPAGCADVQLSVRVATLEKENHQLKSNVTDLQALVKKLEGRISALETTCKPVDSKPAVNHVAPVSKPVPEKKDRKDTENDDDDVDLFGSDEDEEANELREKRLQEYAAKKSKKPQVVAKSSIILDVKPWDDETDMGAMEKEVRKIVMDGLLWGASKLVPLAYGIQKLQICCVVEDEKVSIEELQEKIEAVEELVQSVDIAAFNKI